MRLIATGRRDTSVIAAATAFAHAEVEVDLPGTGERQRGLSRVCCFDDLGSR